MNGAGAKAHSGPSRAMHPFSSIRTRILASITLVLALLIAVSLTVSQVSSELERALQADTASQRSAQQNGAARTALVELRLGVAEYLRTGGTLEKQALEGALSQLERAATAAAEGKSARDRTVLAEQIRTKLASVSEAIEMRRVAAALLDNAAAVLGTSATTLAETASRTGNRSFSEPAAAMLSAVSRAVAASARFSQSDDGASASAVMLEAARAKVLLGESLKLVSSPPRIQQLSVVSAGALDALTTAISQLDVASQKRGDRLTELSALSDHLAAENRKATLAIAAERQQRRAEAGHAQARLRATVLWATAAACLLGSSIAIGLVLSITRSTRRLASAMESIGAGTLDLTLPDGGSSELGQLFAAAELMRSRVQKSLRLRNVDRRKTV